MQREKECRNFKKFFQRNCKGSAILTTPIIIAIGIFIVSMLIAVSVKILMPYIWYEKLSSACIKYIFVMEDYGYLTKTEASALKKELISQGFKKEKLDISYVGTRVKYGEPIFLKITYDYDIDFPLIGEQTIAMVVEKKSVSKR